MILEPDRALIRESVSNVPENFSVEMILEPDRALTVLTSSIRSFPPKKGNHEYSCRQSVGKQKKEIWALVSEADHEFVPTLSVRMWTTQAQLTGTDTKEIPKESFEALTKQFFILCIKCFRAVGFMSYIKDHKFESGESLKEVCDYISMIIVDNKFFLPDRYRFVIK